MKYKLTLTEEQVNIVARACEFYARVRMGQFGEIVWHCADKHCPEDPEEAQKAWLELRKQIYPDLYGAGHNYGMGKFKDADQAFDVYQVIRNIHGDPRGVFSLQDELPVCETIRDEK